MALIGAKDCLLHLYGAVNYELDYAVIDDVRKLLVKGLDIYRRLTI